VSVIYGALPPEVRRREAERFASGESHILVATDAIGMGLNLPIRRVLFSTMVKFDGVADRTAEESKCTRSPAAPAATASTKRVSSAC
jgi:ATP-dependent RNA helicase SUPV3L1/SUV3